AALMLRLDVAAAGRAVLAGHDDNSCVHDVPRPSVSMSNVASLVLPSALSVPSPICRRGAVSIACMASGATTSLHTSYLPTRAGSFPKATDLSEPAISIIVLGPPPAWSDSRTNISRARSLFSQNSRHSIVRNDAPSPCFAAAIELGPREDMQALEFYRLDEIVQITADAHGNDEGGALAVGPRHARLLEIGNLLRREWSANLEREPGVMYGDRCIGR